MALEHIRGADDPRIAAYRDVPDAELVRSRGLFVAEGRLVVRRVIEAGRYRVQSLLVSESACRSLAPVLTTVPSHVPIYVCDPGDFLGITGHDIHRGCLALVDRPPAPDWCALGGGRRGRGLPLVVGGAAGLPRAVSEGRGRRSADPRRRRGHRALCADRDVGVAYRRNLSTTEDTGDTEAMYFFFRLNRGRSRSLDRPF